MGKSCSEQNIYSIVMLKGDILPAVGKFSPYIGNRLIPVIFSEQPFHIAGKSADSFLIHGYTGAYVGIARRKPYIGIIVIGVLFIIRHQNYIRFQQKSAEINSTPHILQPCIGEHEFYAVFLIYTGSAGVIVDGNDVCVGVVLLDGTGHTLCDDMIRQASERLSADDILHT